MQQSTSARFGLPPAGLQSTSFFDSIKGLVIIAVVVLVIAWWLGYLSSGRPAEKGRVAPEKIDEKQRSIEENTASSVQRSQLKYAKVKQHQALLLADDAFKALQDCAVERDAWERLTSPLLENNDGRLIAGDDVFSRRFISVYSEPLLNPRDIERLTKTAFDLHAERKEAFDSSTDASVPSEALLMELRQLLDRANLARRDYRAGRLQVETILASARQSGKPGVKTLKQVLDGHEIDQAFARTARLESEIQRAKDESARKIAEEKVKIIGFESELEADRLRVQAERKRQGLLRSGSVWNGALFIGDVRCPSDLVIARRDKDKIEGSVTWRYLGAKSTGVFTGGVYGTTVKFRITRIVQGNGYSNVDYVMTFDPVRRSLAGTYGRDGQTTGSYEFRLADEPS